MAPLIVVDDTDTTQITYSGSWASYTGSSRQWDSTVHGTFTPGSTATFSFRGTGVRVIGTISAGTASNGAEYSVDGGAPSSASQKSSANAVYDAVFWDSGLLQDKQHTLVVKNVAQAAEFLLDRFTYDGSDNVANGSSDTTTTQTSNDVTTTTLIALVGSNSPSSSNNQPQSSTITSSSSSSSPSSSQIVTAIVSGNSLTRSASSLQGSSTSLSVLVQTAGATSSAGTNKVVSTKYITSLTGQGIQETAPAAAGSSPINSGTSSASASASKSHVPIGAIVGGVLGGIFILLVVIFLLLRSRRRQLASQLPDNPPVTPTTWQRSTWFRPRTAIVTPFDVSAASPTESNMNPFARGSIAGMMKQIKRPAPFTRMYDQDIVDEPQSAAGISVSAATGNATANGGRSYDSKLSSNALGSLSPAAHTSSTALLYSPVDERALSRLSGLSYYTGQDLPLPPVVEDVPQSAFGSARSMVDSEDVPPAYKSAREHNSGTFILIPARGMDNYGAGPSNWDPSLLHR